MEIAAQIVTRFLVAKVNQNPFYVAQVLGVHFKQINEVTLKVISKKLTMQQLYLLTG